MPTDPVLARIADYLCSDEEPGGTQAFETARYCLLDSLGCALQALRFPACRQRLGPIVPGIACRRGARGPGLKGELDPVSAAWNWGCAIRWLDYNDTWLAAEWGHPSDNLGAILALADYQGAPLTVHAVLRAMIQAYEIQGVLALENAFNRAGLDHVLLVRLASAAVTARMLGKDRVKIISALSHAWADGGALRAYRQAPNTCARKSWAAGDAAARGLFLALLADRGEPPLPSILSAPAWGFQAALLRGRSVTLERPLGSFVMENILFKVPWPAEFHAQTAIEAAVRLHPQVRGRETAIERIEVRTQQSAMRIIDKTGPLHNPADRDHCLQYMIAAALATGRVEAQYYEDSFHRAHPRLDLLRDRMRVEEEPRYTRDYLDPNKRSIANSLQVFFRDRSNTEKVEIEYPLGHKRRRREGIPLLMEKLERNLQDLSSQQQREILRLARDRPRLEQTPVRDFVDLFLPPAREDSDS